MPLAVLLSKLSGVADSEIARCAVAPSACISIHRQNSMADTIRFFIEQLIASNLDHHSRWDRRTTVDARFVDINVIVHFLSLIHI